jgi:hypothetical protein
MDALQVRISTRRVARRFLGTKPDGSITVNVWDDDPPGAPIFVEGDLPEGVDLNSLIDFLAGAAAGAGFKVQGHKGPYQWGGSRVPQRFRIDHPTLKGYDDATDNAEHQAFLESLEDLYTGLEFNGHALHVISES